MRKILIPTVILLILIAIIILRPKERVVEYVPIKFVEARIVDQGLVQDRVELLGTVVGEKQVTITPDVIGRVVKKLKPEGSYLKRNEPILIIQNDLVGFEYKKSYVRSPIAGRLAKIFVDVGQRVSPQVPVAMVIDSRDLKIELGIPERFASRLKKGMEAEVLAGTDSRKVRARIYEIGPYVDPQTGTVLSRLRFLRRPEGVLPGMVARVRLIFDERDVVIRIPKESMVEGNVFVIRGGRIHRVIPEVGLSGSDYLEVKSGLRTGDTLVIFGQEFLEDGDSVKVEVES
ncbi:MAG TPA: efflux RND transporter periplasmic adaptor subunit [bacterium (Candidatus Stahlbacteria)]|nr:efflux RND transporter periplasmic adaptor subunit [Candidatus Stahlbacteria bacterium]